MHYVIVPALRTVHQISGRGRSRSVGGGARLTSRLWRLVVLRAASGLDGVALSHSSGWFGSAGLSFSAAAGASKACGPFVGVGVDVLFQGLGTFDGGIQTHWPCVCWRVLQRTRSTVVLWRPFSGSVRSRRASLVRAVQLSCRRYQPRKVSNPLPWRGAWMSSACSCAASAPTWTTHTRQPLWSYLGPVPTRGHF